MNLQSSREKIQKARTQSQTTAKLHLWQASPQAQNDVLVFRHLYRARLDTIMNSLHLSTLCSKANLAMALSNCDVITCCRVRFNPNH